MKTLTAPLAVLALAGLAACSPPETVPSCDPFAPTFDRPVGCDSDDRAVSVAVTVPSLPSVPEAPVTTPDVPDAPTPPADNHPPAVTPPAADKPKGNASANNGRGGNYDRTGHTDNGKGNGRGRP